MAVIDGIVAEIDSYMENSNIVKSIVLDRLFVDKIIKKEQHDHYNENWNVIIIKDSWFKKWAARFNKSKGYFYKYVKFED